jgi:glycosyltransferase involved in cell wall biosynthesis
MSEALFVVGPFPPPVHGAAVITAAVADRLEQHATIRRCDISPGRLSRGLAYHLRRVWRVLAAAAAIVENVGRPGCVYISAAGGSGLLYNLLLTTVARLLRQRLFLHHHSFAYLDRPSATMALLVRMAGDAAVHVVLCSRMAALLRERYPLAARSMIVSNAAFYPAGESAPDRSPGKLVLGHMGNLTDEKGLDLVLDLYREALSSGLAAQLVLAGPTADATAAHEIVAAQEASGTGLVYRGPVYGADKTRFFDDIDVFVFPTRYVNEAEPTVLFEALAHGVPVIALGRGCIPEQLGAIDGEGPGGIVVPVGGAFVKRATEALRGWVASPDGFAAKRRAAQARMAALHEQAAGDFQRLLQAMASGAAR